MQPQIFLQYRTESVQEHLSFFLFFYFIERSVFIGILVFAVKLVIGHLHLDYWNLDFIILLIEVIFQTCSKHDLT